jgi:hypothetical protein
MSKSISLQQTTKFNEVCKTLILDISWSLQPPPPSQSRRQDDDCGVELALEDFC